MIYGVLGAGGREEGTGGGGPTHHPETWLVLAARMVAAPPCGKLLTQWVKNRPRCFQEQTSVSENTVVEPLETREDWPLPSPSCAPTHIFSFIEMKYFNQINVLFSVLFWLLL